ncbi:MAG TPA: M48 family metalloprotease [Steroidobacteraceae bacterium]|nr:M48 family metalloprotease [Steroidobacteraceae bacterium]
MKTRIRPAYLCAVLLLAVACGTNPVTGKREIQFVSQAQEIQIGQQNYAPMRQSEGGDYEVLPELTAYVNEVGQKLVAVSDGILVKPRDLPFEFTVLNNSVPNAWALPGGKIAINRGLLTELRNEAELAAVLGHEIVHSLARHGAQAQERGTLSQVGLVAAQIGAVMGDMDEQTAGLLLTGASVGVQLIHTRYGRGAELESDLYGTRLMKAAGYDPTAAVTLQETFVRLSEGRKSSWLEGLFASHPPSQERVQKNRETAAQLGATGDLGQQRFQAKVAPLLQMKPAYDKYDQALAAMQKKDVATAKSLAADAARQVPREAQFHQLLGDIAVSEKNYQEALAHFQRAQQNNDDYFGSWLGAGVAQYRLGNKTQARQSLQRSYDLLPTAPAALYLGNLLRDAGDVDSAMKYYQAAATSDSSIGQEAAREAVLVDLPRNPGNYVAAQVARDGQGRPVMAVLNRAPVALSSIVITPVRVGADGRAVAQGQQVTIRGPVAAGAQAAADAGLGGLSAEQLGAVRFRIDSARVAQ